MSTSSGEATEHKAFNMPRTAFGKPGVIFQSTQVLRLNLSPDNLVAHIYLTADGANLAVETE